jgi:hypothetical protein
MLFHPRIIFLLLISAVTGAILWLGTLWFSGDFLLQKVSDLLGMTLTGFWGWLLLTLISAPIFFFVSLILLSTLAFPWIRSFVVGTNGQVFSKSGELSLWFQIKEITKFFLMMMGILFCAFLVFWLPPLSALIAFFAMAWSQARFFLLDLSAESESVVEYRLRWQKYRMELLVLSALIVWMAAIPLLGFFVPVFASLVFSVWDVEVRKQF